MAREIGEELTAISAFLLDVYGSGRTLATSCQTMERKMLVGSHVDHSKMRSILQVDNTLAYIQQEHKTWWLAKGAQRPPCVKITVLLLPLLKFSGGKQI